MSVLFPTIEEIRAQISLEPSTVVEQISQVVSNLNSFGRQMNAVSHIAKDYAMTRAEQIHALVQADKNYSSPLLGVPVAHKDSFHPLGGLMYINI